MCRLLGLFGEMLRVVIILRSCIGECVGFCLDDVGVGLVLLVVLVLEEMWFDVVFLELDRILFECVEMFFVVEISSYICESFFMSLESVWECE